MNSNPSKKVLEFRYSDEGRLNQYVNALTCFIKTIENSSSNVLVICKNQARVVYWEEKLTTVNINHLTIIDDTSLQSNKPTILVASLNTVRNHFRGCTQRFSRIIVEDSNVLDVNRDSEQKAIIQRLNAEQRIYLRKSDSYESEIVRCIEDSKGGIFICDNRNDVLTKILYGLNCHKRNQKALVVLKFKKDVTDFKKMLREKELTVPIDVLHHDDLESCIDKSTFAIYVAAYTDRQRLTDQKPDSPLWQLETPRRIVLCDDRKVVEDPVKNSRLLLYVNKGMLNWQHDGDERQGFSDEQLKCVMEFLNPQMPRYTDSKSAHINIYMANAWALTNKRLNAVMLLEKLSPHVHVITEAKIANENEKTYLQIAGYHLEVVRQAKQERNRAGGVAVYIRDDINSASAFKYSHLSPHSTFDLLALDITVKGLVVRLITVYFRPGNGSEKRAQPFLDVLDNLATDHQICMCGDFNHVDTVKAFKKKITEEGLKQHIDMFTRRNKNKEDEGAILDLVIAHPDVIQNKQVGLGNYVDSFYADHRDIAFSYVMGSAKTNATPSKVEPLPELPKSLKV
ncbi:hypothetical protein QR680_007998 [Steinernema hermaphroditum]|uniref:Endonuclease/exonuclease/phosphatase domain-containing protein n=1 Tax=Steinernema hermaphroditum TaxID=289476 RepID=A0AA39IH46_9BILA|nr:hypothetical protein QR680_007998 [Steinernema hermaphroditum]